MLEYWDTLKTIIVPFETKGKIMILGVTILKHFRVKVGNIFKVCSFDIRWYIEISVFEITRVDCIRLIIMPGRVGQSVGHLTRKSGALGSIPGLATYFRFFFRFFKKGSCQLLAKVCARSTS